MAGSSVEMWRHLMSLNHERILLAMESFEQYLELLQRDEVEEIAAWLEKGVAFCKGLSQ